MQEHGTVWDAIVVGAGVAGLTAAVYLARAGRKVLVLEKAAQPGGRAVSTQSHGARLNLGPHALYEKGLSILREVGVEPTGGAPKLSGKLLFDSSHGSLEALDLYGVLLGRKLAWREKSELIRFIAGLRKSDADALAGITLQSYLERELRYPLVRKLAAMLARVSTYSNAPDLLSAGAAVRQMRSTKVVYADGGWQSIVDALRSRSVEAGAVMRMDAPVQRIEGRAPEMTVQLKSGERLAAHTVVSTAGPRRLLELLEAEPASAYAAQLKKLVPVYAACLDLVLDGLPRPRVHVGFGVDQPWYYSNHSACAKLIVSGDVNHVVIHAAKYLRPESQADPAQDEAELERLLDVLQPGWRRRIVLRRFLPQMLVSHALVTAEAGGLRGRPDAAVPGIPGLYTAGDWVGSEGLLLNASLASAKEAARRIIDSSSGKSGLAV